MLVGPRAVSASFSIAAALDWRLRSRSPTAPCWPSAVSEPRSAYGPAAPTCTRAADQKVEPVQLGEKGALPQTGGCTQP